MDYKHYRREGLSHGTAHLESDCKNMVGSLLKKGGARWLVNALSARHPGVAAQREERSVRRGCPPTKR